MANQKKERILIKYGGNAMKDEALQKSVINVISSLKAKGYAPILVHGGGPFIEQFLEYGKIQSKFVQGLRFTSEESIPFVEAALRGFVNGNLVGLALREGLKAIGLSGKDGRSVTCIPKKVVIDDKQHSIGRVGEVESIDTSLYETLLDDDYFPILASIAMDEEGYEYNVNADIFAGALAAALDADHFMVLTNIDGLMEDPAKPETIIHEIDEQTLKTSDKIKISEGMMPKMEACFTAANGGVKNVRIINGQKPELFFKALTEGGIGTKILQNDTLGV